MIPALLGRKIGMTRVYDETGRMVPVTVVQAGPCSVTQVKSDETDGYHAVQLGFEDAKPRHSTFPLIGHCGKAGIAPKRHFKEVRLTEATDKAAGDAVDVNVFADVKFVDVMGISKGKGFAGAMKRHNFGGLPASHGTERKHRARGSICSVATNRGFSGKPKKGVKMAGHMGDAQVTVQNNAIIKIDAERNVLLIKGPVPGANGGLLFIRKAKTKV